MQLALRLLSLRARSRRELKVALARKGFAEPQQEAVLARLGELGYVDDVRFAQDRASALLRSGRLGPRAVLQRLFAHGLSEEQAKLALSLAHPAPTSSAPAKRTADLIRNTPHKLSVPRRQI